MADNLHTQVGAADTPAALAEAADTLVALAEAHIAPALLLAAGRLAGLEPLRPPERSARHLRLAGLHRNPCKIFGPEETVCHKKGKTL
ncbi:MAG: hypothetical protein ABSD20_12235 [Terriglobales bacterium]